MMSGKKSLRWLIAASVIAALQSQALTTTIVVNTKEDENGANQYNCSLREALQAAKNKAAFGGCSTGAVSGTNLIQLDTGTYTLTLGELLVAAGVTIAGKDTVRADEINSYTGKKPNRVRPDHVADPDITGDVSGTAIQAAAGSRIFNALSDIVLRDVELKGATVAANGGIINASASITMDNVIVSNGDAVDNGAVQSNGGAIYLNRNESNVSLTDVTFKNNRASGSGGVIAMVCSEDGRLAAHDISSNRALFQGNTADAGAGFIHACGDTTITLSTTTLSANSSSPAFGAITYHQSSPSLGSVALSFLTVAEHTSGYVLSLRGLSSITMNHTVLIGNTSANCQFLPTSQTQPSLTKYQGTFNAITSADTSCDVLLSSGTNNGNQKITTALNAELLPLADHGGLVDGYLPLSSSLFVLNKGGEEKVFDNCTAVDQRGFVRKNGSTCDLGAVERLEATANDDTGVSKFGTDRWVIIDVLANDFFGESDTGPNTYADPSVVVGSGADNPNGQCTWMSEAMQLALYPENPEYANKLIVRSKTEDPDGSGPLEPIEGIPTAPDQPIECKYRVSFIPNGGVAPQLSPSDTAAVVKSTVKNAAPVAVADSYLRPIGVGSILINPILNDNDSGDGVYGTPAELWPDFPVYISKNDLPQLGKIEGTQGRCSDYTATNGKLCYAVPFTYVSNNSIDGFADSFKYSVQDQDAVSSSSAVVTIKTDALNPDEGQTGGSLDIFGGFFLVLLGLRRMRKL